MGYRTYIYSIPKREYNKIKSMTKEELVTHYKVKRSEYEIEDGYLGISVYNLGKELYEFGKYTDFTPPKKSMKTFFKNKELNNYFMRDNELFVVTPEFLEYVIGTYQKRISDYYNEMMMPFFGKKDAWHEREKATTFFNSVKIDYSHPNNKYHFDFSLITDEEQDALYNILEHTRQMRHEWTALTPYDLKNGGDEITTSWKYEYGIFELVRIYKSFDWKKNIMYFAGW